MSSGLDIFPTRPRRTLVDGDFGVPVQLFVNAVKAKLREGHFYRYLIWFGPSNRPEKQEISLDSKKQRLRILKETFQKEGLYEKYGECHFDNALIYASKRVMGEKKFYYSSSDKSEKKSIRITYQGLIDFRRFTYNDERYSKDKKLTPEEITQISHLMLQTHMRQLHYSDSCARNLYVITNPHRANIIRVRQDLSLLPAFHAQFEVTGIGLALFVNNRTRLLSEKNVAQLMHQWLDESGSEEEWKQWCNKELRVRHVLLLHREGIDLIHGIDWNQTIQDFLPPKPQQKKMTFIEYYRERYGIELKERNLPLLKRGNIFYPAELCKLTGYPRHEADNRYLRKEVAKRSALPINTRILSIEKLATDLGEVSSEADEEKTWPRIEYKNELIPIEGRQLPPANIVVYTDKIHVIPDDQLQKVLKNTQPHGIIGNSRPYIVQWDVLYFGDRDPSYAVQELVDHYKTKIKKIFYNGYNLKDYIKVALSLEPKLLNVQRFSEIETKIKRLNEARSNALVIILPNEGEEELDEIYMHVKYLCNCKLGLISQCIRIQNLLGRGKLHVIDGSFRQLLTKIGLIPWKVLLSAPGMQLNNSNQEIPQSVWNYLPDGVIDLTKPTMIIGVDVSHDPSGESVVGFISTYDTDFVKVVSQVSVQGYGQEVLDKNQFSELMDYALTFFKAQNNVFPEQIIYYRDGVSWSQMKEVEKNEKRAAESIFKEKYERGHLPKLEIIIIQKRVNARFFSRENTDYFSAPPRTIVDEGITSKDMWDFYLVAAKAPEDKCANPIRCIVINDGLDLANSRKTGVNDLEALTYAFCCMYTNWPGAIKIPHVVKYADKVASFFNRHKKTDNKGSPISIHPSLKATPFYE